MSGRFVKARALLALGVSNLARVALYRVGLRLNAHPVQRLRKTVCAGRFFAPVSAAPMALEPSADWQEAGPLFGWYAVPVDGPPQWATDMFTGAVRPGGDVPWWQLPDFGEGDIKAIWELSRFNWLVPLAQRARNGDTAALDRIESWLRDWIGRNPPYRGHNWKCAQEASIRVLHLAMAALILDQDRTMQAPLRDLLNAHLARIRPTLGYAAAQDNNHATSEAAALYIGGTWLAACGMPEGSRLAARGRRHLERCVLRLFAPDGGFSQYSVTYHRLALDTVSLVEAWRRRHDDRAFGAAYLARAAAATEWLRHMVDQESGGAPNLGANDGADLLQLGAAYRDFRPSVQLAAALFLGSRAYPAGAWDDAAGWLGVSLSAELAPPPSSKRFDDTGYAVLRSGEAWAAMRYPRYRFRPNDADPLHLDLWVQGRNLLRDGGTFSYNCDAPTMEYFRGIQSHNTIQFDDAEPMPRVSRFLHGDWLRTEERGEVIGGSFDAAYRDAAGHRHHRSVELGSGRLRVTDEIAGVRRKAVLRWRLAPGDWTLADTTVKGEGFALRVTGNRPMRARLVTGHESLHYLQSNDLPVLEVEVDGDGTLTTEIDWGS